MLTTDRHRDRHRWLHRAVDELVQDYLRHHPDDPDTVMDLSVWQLLTWAAAQAVDPTEPASESHRDGVLLYAWVNDQTRDPLPASAVPAPEAVTEAVPLAAHLPDVVDHPDVRAALEQLAQSAGLTLRLVRCVEVETVRAVNPRVP